MMLERRASIDDAMHDWEWTEKSESSRSLREPFRKGARKENRRRYAEHCDYGDVIEYDERPRVRYGPDEGLAPGTRGRVTMFVRDTAFVRFELCDAISEPIAVCPRQGMRLVRSSR